MKKGKNKEIAEDYCFICKDGGDLRICDHKNCLKAYHPACVNKDVSFLDSDEKWTCGWHLCSCHKSATFRCLCCSTSFCRACVKSSDFGSAKGQTKGFCKNCLKLAIMIEENTNVDSDGNEVDFEDTGNYEFLFKDYWEIIKEQEGLTLADLHAANACLKSGEHLIIESDSDKSSEDHEMNSKVDDMAKDYVDGILCLDDIKIPRTENIKRRPKWSRSKKKNFVGWGSEELIWFLTSIGKSTEKPLTQLDVCEIVKAYAVKNNCVETVKSKKKVHCDDRLKFLFRKKSLWLYKIFSLLESHLVENQDSDDEYYSSHEDDEEARKKKERKLTLDSKYQGWSGSKTGKQASEISKNCYASIVGKNIKLVYLKRSLIIELLKNLETFQRKIVGCFVRAKNDTKVFYFSPGKVYQLGQVLGVKKAKEEYMIGETTTDIILQVSNMFKDIPLNILSDDDFEEEECQDLQLLVQKGLVKRPTVADLEKKVQIIHEDIMNHWIDKEIMKLQKQIDRANEKGWRKELFEYVEQRNLLRQPDERMRLLKLLPEVVADIEKDAGKLLPEIQENKKCIEVSSPDQGPEEKITRGVNYFPNIFERLNNGVDDMPNTPRKWRTSFEVSSRDQGIEDKITRGVDYFPNISEQLNNGDDNVPDAPRQWKINCLEEDVVRTQVNEDSPKKGAILITCDQDNTSSASGQSNFSEAAAAIGLEAAENDPDLVQEWHYFDCCGEVQGPVSKAALRIWKFEEGYLDDDFKVWRTGQSHEQAILLNIVLGRLRS